MLEEVFRSFTWNWKYCNQTVNILCYMSALKMSLKKIKTFKVKVLEAENVLYDYYFIPLDCLLSCINVKAVFCFVFLMELTQLFCTSKLMTVHEMCHCDKCICFMCIISTSLQYVSHQVHITCMSWLSCQQGDGTIVAWQFFNSHDWGDITRKDKALSVPNPN